VCILSEVAPCLGIKHRLNVEDNVENGSDEHGDDVAAAVAGIVAAGPTRSGTVGTTRISGNHRLPATPTALVGRWHLQRFDQSVHQCRRLRAEPEQISVKTYSGRVVAEVGRSPSIHKVAQQSLGRRPEVEEVRLLLIAIRPRLVPWFCPVSTPVRYRLRAR
jgi:hypothetical protein